MICEGFSSDEQRCDCVMERPADERQLAGGWKHEMITCEPWLTACLAISVKPSRHFHTSVM